MQYKSRSQLLRDAAESIEMQEAAGVEPVCKFYGNLWAIAGNKFNSLMADYEFPLAVVEGKQVWVGSELYAKSSGIKYRIGKESCFPSNGIGYGLRTDKEFLETMSWNPLNDDGDALRLAVKLGISINHEVWINNKYVGANSLKPCVGADERYGSDPYAATRRAIVRAAAEIGRMTK